MSLADLNGASIERDVTEWWKSSYRLSKTLEDDYPAAAMCAAQLREDTTSFREHLPIIQVRDCLVEGGLAFTPTSTTSRAQPHACFFQKATL